MVRTDVRPGHDHGLDGDEPSRFRARRLIRWAVILTVGVLTVLAAWQEPLSAGH